MQLPDYLNCITNVVASISTNFGLDAPHPGLAYVDALLRQKDYRSIVLMLMDGLSLDTLARHLPPDSFLRRQPSHELSAVFPSTTTAATTSAITGLNPGEHGWLGWTLYFEQLNASVDIFGNTLQFSKDQAAPFHAASHFLPYESITDRISATGRAQGLNVSAYGDVVVGSLAQLMSETARLCAQPGRHYLYAYYGEPDHLMHLLGCGHDRVRAVCQSIDQSIGQLAAGLPEDSLLLVTADHGLVDAQPDVIEDHPALADMLIRPPSIELRAAALYVKPADKKAFPDAFREAFGDRYLLLSGEEAISRGLFGPGAILQGISGLVGDYLAIALADHALFPKREHCKLIGMHAGLTSAEMRLPLIVAKA